MATRSAVQAFGVFFNLLAEGELTDEKRELAHRLYPRRYEFVAAGQDPQMGCDAALCKLGLATREKYESGDGMPRERIVYT